MDNAADFQRMHTIKKSRAKIARWLAIIAWGLAGFAVGLPFCTDTFFLRWDLVAIAELAWLLSAISFVLRPSILAVILFCAGLTGLVWVWLK